MNWTEYDLLTKDELFSIIDKLEEDIDFLELKLECRNKQIENDSYTEGYEEGLADGKTECKYT